MYDYIIPIHIVKEKDKRVPTGWDLFKPNVEGNDDGIIKMVEGPPEGI